ncbi:hypothetical protein D1872_311210 [compost metagenome]
MDFIKAGLAEGDYVSDRTVCNGHPGCCAPMAGHAAIQQSLDGHTKRATSV